MIQDDKLTCGLLCTHNLGGTFFGTLHFGSAHVVALFLRVPEVSVCRPDKFKA